MTKPGDYTELQEENERLNRQLTSVSRELETVIEFLLELQQWGSNFCRCSTNAHLLIDKLRHGLKSSPGS